MKQNVLKRLKMAFSDFWQNWKQEKRVQLERCTRFHCGKIVF